MQLGNSHSVFIVMGLCDETLKARIQRKGFNGDEARWVAARELCEGLGYLHGLQKAITHRDLKPSNVLFKGSCLKIADMGQSRILAKGETAVPTGSSGGGWMSPEEIEWDNGGSMGGSQFRAHLSGDGEVPGNGLSLLSLGLSRPFQWLFRRSPQRRKPALLHPERWGALLRGEGLVAAGEHHQWCS